MRYLILWSLIAPSAAFAQGDFSYALPVSTDLVTLFRSADIASDTITMLTSDDVLLTRCDSTGWCWAQNSEGKEGYVRRERINPLTAIDDSSALVWLTKIFHRYQELGVGYNTAFQNTDLTKQKAYSDSLNDHDQAFVAAQTLFKPYFCRTAADALLLAFMRAVATTPGSASEEPPTTLAVIFKCRPTEFNKALRELTSSESDIVLDATTTGFLLLYDEHDRAQQYERDSLIKTLHER